MRCPAAARRAHCRRTDRFFMSGDYKTDRIEHDNEIAGTLLRHGVDSGIIASAFTVEKTAADQETGASLLASSGYDQQVKSSLLPEVWHFQNKYMMFTLGIVILFSAAILTALFSAETRRSRQLEAAADQLRRLMEGTPPFGSQTAVRAAFSGFSP